MRTIPNEADGSRLTDLSNGPGLHRICELLTKPPLRCGQSLTCQSFSLALLLEAQLFHVRPLSRRANQPIVDVPNAGGITLPPSEFVDRNQVNGLQGHDQFALVVIVAV